ncbi:hypothetical protein BM1_00724 [Bipolaris maydis]|nr:hypothetical protein BM1_00724 [Bipolaris maydis]KAJ6276519.1 hypothetical protein J3E71DRAFT_187253 [Bipolaris maydis]KAJ6276559.1 hypothetical protein J3E71DRAFT_348048 [Bipolaris maydis]
MCPEPESKSSTLPLLSNTKEDNDLDEPNRILILQKPKHLGWIIVVFTLGTTALGFTVIAFTIGIIQPIALIIPSTANLSTKTKIEAGLNCGRSPTEARKRGCSFDPMIHSWVHKACHMPDLLAEFMAVNRTFYYDSEHKHPLPPSVLWAGELDHYYPTTDQHFHHCLYTFRRLALAYATNSYVDEDSGSIGHNKHCSEYVDPMLSQPISSPSTLTFSTCIRPGYTNSE